MRRLLPPALVALVAFAVFANTLSHQFVYDDNSVIVENPRVHHLANWREIVTSPWWPRGLYRPVTSLTLAANWTLDPGDPFGFHLVNVLLHADRRGAGRRSRRAAHGDAGRARGGAPLRGASGARRGGGQCGGTGGGAGHGVRRSPRRWRTCASAISPGDAGGRAARVGSPPRAPSAPPCSRSASKESAFALPGILLAVGLGSGARRRRPFASAASAEPGPLWMRRAAGGRSGGSGSGSAVVGELAGDVPAPGLAGTSVLDRMAIMLAVVPQYLRLLLYPARLSAEYSPDFLPVSTRLGRPAGLGLVSLLGFAGSPCGAAPSAGGDGRARVGGGGHLRRRQRAGAVRRGAGGADALSRLGGMCLAPAGSGDC